MATRKRSLLPKKAQNYLGWLMPIMMMHPDFENLIQGYDKESHLGKVPSNTRWSVKTQHIQEVFSQKVKQIIDDETLKTLLNMRLLNIKQKSSNIYNNNLHGNIPMPKASI